MTRVEAPVRTKAVMDRIEDDVREAIRRRAIERGGVEFSDPAVFQRVWSLLAHATGSRDPDVLLLPELLDDHRDWDLQPQLSLSSHRPALGPIILLLKRRLLLPLSRWLLEYVSENFRRQHRINRPTFEVVMTPELERLLDDGMQDLDQAKTTRATAPAKLPATANRPAPQFPAPIKPPSRSLRFSAPPP